MRERLRGFRESVLGGRGHVVLAHRGNLDVVEGHPATGTEGTHGLPRVLRDGAASEFVSERVH
ncbi:hypothetical protein I4J28_10620 [Corynebacterium belfantii]|nr:hypothetical protein [Corynebacterium belfantii]